MILNIVLMTLSMAPLRMEDAWLLHSILEPIVEYNSESGR